MIISKRKKRINLCGDRDDRDNKNNSNAANSYPHQKKKKLAMPGW